MGGRGSAGSQSTQSDFAARLAEAKADRENRKLLYEPSQIEPPSGLTGRERQRFEEGRNTALGIRRGTLNRAGEHIEQQGYGNTSPTNKSENYWYRNGYNAAVAEVNRRGLNKRS